MSSYLTFYGVPKLKKVEEKGDDYGKKVEDPNAEPVEIVSFSRNNDIYRYFNDNLNIPFCSDGMKYGDITPNDVDTVENDIKSDIKRSEDRLKEYEKYAGQNQEYIMEILNIKEYLEDLYRALHYTEFVGFIVNEASGEYCGSFTKIVANVG